ncbi:MAG TPA: class I SAM-dependent methyltransferase [bacterium]|nr:class I SAM-dependent methyltransferase [bacterium]
MNTLKYLNIEKNNFNLDFDLFSQVYNRVRKEIRKDLRVERRFRDLNSRLYLYELYFNVGKTFNIFSSRGKCLGLDIGCGKGHLTSILNELGIETIGIDLLEPEGNQDFPKDKAELKRLWQKLGSQFATKFLFASARHLPFCKGSFDFVIFNSSFEHICKREEEFSELLRKVGYILKPGAFIFIFLLPNKYSFLEWILKKPYLKSKYFPHKRAFSYKELRRIVEKADYKIVEAYLSHFFPYMVSNINPVYSVYNFITPGLLRLENILFKTKIRKYFTYYTLVLKGS